MKPIPTLNKWSLNPLRIQILVKLGGKCRKCGYKRDIRAIQIDHVNGGGKADRAGGMEKFYKRVLSDTTGAYQLLCANCNWIKRWEDGTHGGHAPVRSDDKAKGGMSMRRAIKDKWANIPDFRSSYWRRQTVA